MFSVQLSPGLRFKIGTDNYTILKHLESRKVQVEHHGYQTPIIFTKDELIRLLCKGDLQFEVKGKNITPSAKGEISTSYYINDIESTDYKEEALFRFQVIKPLLKAYGRTRADIKARVEEINELIKNPILAAEKLETSFYKKVSVATLYRWISDYENSHGDIRALVPSYQNSGGRGKARIHPKAVEFVHDSIKETYLNQQRVTIEETFFDVVARITNYNEFSNEKIGIPSYVTITRIISRIPEFELVEKRLSKRNAEIRFEAIGNGVKASYPLERVEIDATPLDLIVVFADGAIKERPYFVAAIDKLTRQILGFSLGFGGVGWPETMQCLRHVLSDKSYIKEKYPFINNDWNAFGVPGTIVIDNGLEFKNGPMKDACFQLGINLEFAPPRLPQWKGSIERFFGTTETNFSHKQPGTTRSNPQKLAEGENPKDNACIPFNILLGLLHKWIIDIYSQDLNKGAGGIPAKIWEKMTDDYPVDWPNSTHELPILLGRLSYRIISNRGIELKLMCFNSTELNKILRKFSKENHGAEQKFKVKYDPLNLGCVYLYDHLFSKQWIKVPNVCPEYAEGLSEWEHEESRKLAIKEFGTVDIVSLAKAKKFLRDQAAAWTSKNRQRKAAKMQSDQEIFGGSSQNYNRIGVKVDYKLPQDSNNKTITHSGISDIGESYEPSQETHILPGSLTLIDETKLQKKKKEKKRISKTRIKKHCRLEELDSEYEDLSPSDLNGFGVISHTEGDFF